MKRKITIYTSFEEQKADEVAYANSLTGEQHIAEAVTLMKGCIT